MLPCLSVFRKNQTCHVTCCCYKWRIIAHAFSCSWCSTTENVQCLAGVWLPVIKNNNNNNRIVTHPNTIVHCKVAARHRLVGLSGKVVCCPGWVLLPEWGEQNTTLLFAMPFPSRWGPFFVVLSACSRLPGSQFSRNQYRACSRNVFAVACPMSAH